MVRRVIVLDDDAMLLRTIIRSLRSAGLDAEGFSHPEDFRTALEAVILRGEEVSIVLDNVPFGMAAADVLAEYTGRIRLLRIVIYSDSAGEREMAMYREKVGGIVTPELIEKKVNESPSHQRLVKYLNS